MDTLKEGEKLKITGIGGKIEYLGNSNFNVINETTLKKDKKRFKRVGLIAAGSGIAPMF